MSRQPSTVTALYLTGTSNSAWRVDLADNAAIEVQFADASAPLIVRRTSNVHADRRPRPIVGLDAVPGEPLRYTIVGQRERYEAVVTAVTRIRPFCARCGERLLAGVCSRNLVDPTYHRSRQETKWAGKPLSWRRRLACKLEPLLRWLDGPV